jgi:hypothetical protein
VNEINGLQSKGCDPFFFLEFDSAILEYGYAAGVAFLVCRRS